MFSETLEAKSLCKIRKVVVSKKTNSKADKLVQSFMEKNYRSSAKMAKKYEVDLEEKYGSGKYEFEIFGISCLEGRCIAFTNEGEKSVGDYIEDSITAEEVTDATNNYKKQREKIYRITFVGIFLPSKTVKFKSKETRWKQ